MDEDQTDALRRKFERIARRLPESVLTGATDDAMLTEELAAHFGHQGTERLLGYYAREGIQAALEEYGIFDALRARDYQDFQVVFDLQDFQHTFQVFGDGLRLCECRLRRAAGASDPCIAEFQRHAPPALLVVEWLSLSDPRATFTAQRPALPGQDHPGSGIGDEVFTLLYLCARRLGLHGLLEVPERFHNAVFYRRHTHFIDPAQEGLFLALLKLLDHHPLGQVAWALETGRIIDKADGQPVRWSPREQMACLDPALARYFELPAWRRARTAAVSAHRLHLLPETGHTP